MPRRGEGGDGYCVLGLSGGCGHCRLALGPRCTCRLHSAWKQQVLSLYLCLARPSLRLPVVAVAMCIVSCGQMPSSRRCIISVDLGSVVLPAGLVAHGGRLRKVEGAEHLEFEGAIQDKRTPVQLADEDLRAAAGGQLRVSDQAQRFIYLGSVSALRLNLSQGTRLEIWGAGCRTVLMHTHEHAHARTHAYARARAHAHEHARARW
jgi:hypothetical protein